jgi:hypothetical protein
MAVGGAMSVFFCRKPAHKGLATSAHASGYPVEGSPRPATRLLQREASFATPWAY